MGADLFNGDLSIWDTSAVTDMSLMFQCALTFKGIGMSSWDTSSVTTLFAAFEEAGSFIGNISTFDTSNVIDMQRTFQYASSFNSDISQWNVSKVMSFSYAFSGASSFNRDLSSWDVSAANSMIGMVGFWMSINAIRIALCLRTQYLTFLDYNRRTYVFNSFPVPRHLIQICVHGDRV